MNKETYLKMIRANQEDALIRTIDAFEQFVSYSEMSEFAVPGEVDTILMKLLKLRDEMYL
jgi:hypothetical protein